ncbi:Histidine phosphatase (branch 2) family protein [Acanthocheilonema viteae]
MYGIILLPICAILIETINAQKESDEELVYVQAIWRHGDRAPNHLPYPNDKYKETAWPRGWGQITNIGMMQMYELGEFFRKRYASFIANFNKEDVNLVSSSSDRAIVSGLAMLRGFFPANGQEAWLHNEQWQPLPFQIETTDALLRPTNFDCKTYDLESKKENEVLYRNISEKYADFFDFLANVTGHKKVDFKKAASLYDIQREMDNNMTQPLWVYQIWPQFDNKTTIGIIRNLKRIRRISEFNSAGKAQLRGGLLMEDWIDRAKNVSLGLPVTPRKIKLYSAHDGTVLALMYALGVSNDLLVPYASCAIMEIYKTANNHTTIKFFYKNGTNIYQLALPGCSSNDNCTIAQVKKAIATRSVQSLQQLNEICASNESLHNTADFLIIGYLNIPTVAIMLIYQMFINEL